jgi:hypothetical protein
MSGISRHIRFIFSEADVQIDVLVCDERRDRDTVVVDAPVETVPPSAAGGRQALGAIRKSSSGIDVPLCATGRT